MPRSVKKPKGRPNRAISAVPRRSPGRSAVVAIVAAAFGFAVSLYPVPESLRPLTASPLRDGASQAPSADSTYFATRRAAHASALRLTALVQLSQDLDDETLYAGAETLTVLVREFGLRDVMRSYVLLRSIQPETRDFPQVYSGGGGSGQSGELVPMATLLEYLLELFPDRLPELIQRLEGVVVEHLLPHHAPEAGVGEAPAPEPAPAPAPAPALAPAPEPAVPVGHAPTPDRVPSSPTAEVTQPTVPVSVPVTEPTHELEPPTVTAESSPSAPPSGPPDDVATETSQDPSPARPSESPQDPQPQSDDSAGSPSDRDNNPESHDSSPAENSSSTDSDPTGGE